MDNSIALVILSWVTVLSSLAKYTPAMIMSAMLSVYFASELMASYGLVQEKFYRDDRSDSESDTEEDYSDLPPLIPISEVYNTDLRSRFNRDRNVLAQLRAVEAEVAARNTERARDAQLKAERDYEAALKAEQDAVEMLNNLGSAMRDMTLKAEKGKGR